MYYYVTLMNLGPSVGPFPNPIKGPGFNNHRYKEAYIFSQNQHLSLLSSLESKMHHKMFVENMTSNN